MRLVIAVIICLCFPAQALAKSDGDGMPSWWEKKYKLSVHKNDGGRDPDADKLSNRREFRYRTNPRSADTDKDGISDGAEVKLGSNPRKADALKPKPEQPKVDPEPLVQTGQRGVFVVNCSLTAKATLDPIIDPGNPNFGHQHEFFGPTSISASDRPADLIQKPTSCGLESDRSAYWMPSLLNHGAPVDGDLLQAYYFLSDRTQAFPRGLSMVAGKPSLSVSDPKSASWSCQPSSNYGQTTLPPCPASNYILSEVRFPSCWNGKDLDSTDHRSHMSYLTSSGACPRSHPVELPELVMFRTFTQYDGLLNGASLSSGSTGGLHADFVSGWDEAALTDLINSCRNRNCARVGNQVPVSLARAAGRTSPAAPQGLSSRFFCNLADQF